MEDDYGRITAIQFSQLKPEFIRKLSVREITNPSLTTRKTATENGPDDGYLGATSRTNACKLCKQNLKKCPGHFGHASLAVPVTHPAHIKHLFNVVHLFCPHCSRILFPIPCAPDNHPCAKSWNDYATKMNIKFFKICKQFKGIDRLSELAKIVTKRVLSCGIPSETILPEILEEKDKKNNNDNGVGGLEVDIKKGNRELKICFFRRCFELECKFFFRVFFFFFVSSSLSFHK